MTENGNYFFSKITYRQKCKKLLKIQNKILTRTNRYEAKQNPWNSWKISNQVDVVSSDLMLHLTIYLQCSFHFQRLISNHQSSRWHMNSIQWKRAQKWRNTCCKSLQSVYFRKNQHNSLGRCRFDEIIWIEKNINLKKYKNLFMNRFWLIYLLLTCNEAVIPIYPVLECEKLDRKSDLMPMEQQKINKTISQFVVLYWLKLNSFSQSPRIFRKIFVIKYILDEIPSFFHEKKFFNTKMNNKFWVNFLEEKKCKKNLLRSTTSWIRSTARIMCWFLNCKQK